MAETYDDNKFYTVKVLKPFPWPANSRNFIHPNASNVELKGKVLNALDAEFFSDATEIVQG